MSLLHSLDIAGAGMSAQSVRLNVTASNLANAGSVAGAPQEVYRPRHVVFGTFDDAMSDAQMPMVRVMGVTQSRAEPVARHAPGHPLADAGGNVYESPVSTVEQMVEMMAASRAYRNNVEVMDTTKQLLLRTISVGQ